MGARRLGPESKRRCITDVGVLLRDPLQLGGLRLGHDRDIADLAEAEQPRVELEDLHRPRDQFIHRRREVEVAHDPAGDARRARPDTRLLQHDDPSALLGEVVGGREPMHARAQNNEAGRVGDHAAA